MPDVISVVVPAYNEEGYLGETLASLNRARAVLEKKVEIGVEILVVDNGSSDATARIALQAGARVVEATSRNIALVRNAGARLCAGSVIVFVDADTVVPDALFVRIWSAMSDPACLGGAVDAEMRVGRAAVRAYLACWRALGKLMQMAQGATQFCRREAFFSIAGYDETLFMGEDVDFFSRLKALAKRQRGRLALISDIQVVPSPRRFDQWPIWRIVIWTNPLFIVVFRRKRAWWSAWYDRAVR
jgi:glycosyltransferase involved in cell wall biosynthesis